MLWSRVSVGLYWSIFFFRGLIIQWIYKNNVLNYIQVNYLPACYYRYLNIMIFLFHKYPQSNNQYPQNCRCMPINFINVNANLILDFPFPQPNKRLRKTLPPLPPPAVRFSLLRTAMKKTPNSFKVSFSIRLCN